MSQQVNTDSKLGIYTMTLKNGMRVVMKPTPFDEGSIFIQVTALRGYSSFSDERNQIAARVSPYFVFQSQLGSFDAEQLSVALFEHEVEFSVEIENSIREIQGYGPTDSSSFLLQLINNVFTEIAFDRGSFEVIKKQLKKEIDSYECDRICNYDATFVALNTENAPSVRRLTAQDVAKITFDSVDLTFHEAFREPAEFICTIVGDFKIEEMIPLIEQHLQVIPKTVSHKEWASPPPSSFPPGVVSKTLGKLDFTENLTRITYPISAPMNLENYQALGFIGKVIEGRLQRVLREELKSAHGIDVSSAFPFFPVLDPAWMTIQFRSNDRITARIIRVIQNELRELKRKGPSEEDMDLALKQKERLDNFWKRDNDFWITSLTSFYLRGWNPEDLFQKPPSREKTTEALQSFIPLDNYTIITSEI